MQNAVIRSSPGSLFSASEHTRRGARAAVVVTLIVVLVSGLGAAADYIRGITFGALWWPAFDRELVAYNLYRLADVGVDSIAVHPNWFVESYTDPTLEPWYRDRPGFPDTNWWYPTLYDEEVAYIVETAHSLGMSVMLKLYVAVLDDPVTHVGGYGLHPSGGRWDELFDSYQAYANHYAALCEDLDVEILCLGTELESMTHADPNVLRDPDRRWRELIADVRAIYSGKLTYSCALMGSWDRPYSSPADVTFWDALDYIGLELYRGLTNTFDPTVAQLTAGLRSTFGEFVRPLALRYGRPILIPEINFMHCDGTNMRPYAPDNPAAAACDYQEHADCYEAVLGVIDEISASEDYFAGIYWWSGMLVDPCEDLTPRLVESCTGTELWGTPAETIVRDAWSGANGWEKKGLSADISPREASDAGCRADSLTSHCSPLPLVEAVPAPGWSFDHWEGAVDLPTYPIAALTGNGTAGLSAVFGRDPCWPAEQADTPTLLIVDGFSRDTASLDCFWFAGGESRCKEMEPTTSDGSSVLRYRYPSDGSAKVALRFASPFDASSYEGVQLTVRANSTVSVGVEVASQDRGLHLQENADDWKSSYVPCSIEVAPVSRTFRMPFDAFLDPDWISSRYPDAVLGVRTRAIWEIQFMPQSGECILEILEVSFYRDEA